MKKIIALISAFMLSVCAVSSNVNAVSLNRPLVPNGDDSINTSEPLYQGKYGTGGLWEEVPFDSENSILDCQTYSNIGENSVNSTIPTSFDITSNPSTSVYFPPIGNQGQINSCAGWASTYYQFTYETNKLKGTPTTSSNIYSPSWTYNYINGGSNRGASLDRAYSVLENQGAMYLNNYPHSQYASSYNFNWSSDLPKMRKALEYRAKTSYIAASNYNLSNLNDIKSKLSSGKVAVVWTNVNGWTIRTNSYGENVIIRGSEEQGNINGHYMTVVGYDDNFRISINGQTLKGALKLANSWGTSWNEGNNGYIWVLYDALLSTSAYGSSWQSGFTSNRKPIFGGDFTNSNNANAFYFMNVYKCDVYFTETIQFTSYDPWYISIWCKNGTAASENLPYLRRKKDENAPILNSVDTRYLVFDYTKTDVSINPNNYLSTYWNTHMTGNNTNFSTYDISSRLTDNLGNEIETFNHVYYAMNHGEFTQVHHSNIAKGRITAYDNHEITYADSQLVLQAAINNVELSSLQRFLADYNNDGEVNVADSILMNNHIASLNNTSYSLYEKLPGWDYSLAEIIEKESAISIDDFIDNNKEMLNTFGVIYKEE